MLAKEICISAVLLLTGYSGTAEAQEIPCTGAPKDAVVKVPEPIKDLAAVTCSRYGHFLTGADGTIWTYPGAMAPAMLIAYVDAADQKQLPSEVGHSKHFSSIKVRDIPSGEVRALLSDDGFSETSPSGSVHAIEITAVNQDGVEQRAYVFSSGTNRWGYLCDPKCKPKNSFMVLEAPS